MTELTAVRGVGPAMARHMETQGLTTVQQLVVATPEQLCALPGVQLVRARSLISAARELLLAAELEMDAIEDVQDMAVIPSVDPSVDLEILGDLSKAAPKTDKAKKAAKKAANTAGKSKKKKKKSKKSPMESAKAKMEKAGKAVSAKSDAPNKTSKKKSKKKKKKKDRKTAE